MRMIQIDVNAMLIYLLIDTESNQEMQVGAHLNEQPIHLVSCKVTIRDSDKYN